jgi:cytochrome c556
MSAPHFDIEKASGMTGMRWSGAALAAVMGLGAVVVAGGALARDDDPMPKNASAATKAAYARHEHFEELGKTFKALNEEMKKDAPDKAAVAADAKTISTLASGLPTWFPKGSGVEARPKSEAKADIWSDAAGFSAAAANLQAQVSKLNQAAVAGDLGAVKAQLRPTGGACKNCHDKFRKEKS